MEYQLFRFPFFKKKKNNLTIFHTLLLKDMNKEEHQLIFLNQITLTIYPSILQNTEIKNTAISPMCIKIIVHSFNESRLEI